MGILLVFCINFDVWLHFKRGVLQYTDVKIIMHIYKLNLKITSSAQGMSYTNVLGISRVILKARLFYKLWSYCLEKTYVQPEKVSIAFLVWKQILEQVVIWC